MGGIFEKNEGSNTIEVTKDLDLLLGTRNNVEIESKQS